MRTSNALLGVMRNDSLQDSGLSRKWKQKRARTGTFSTYLQPFLTQHCDIGEIFPLQTCLETTSCKKHVLAWMVGLQENYTMNMLTWKVKG